MHLSYSPGHSRIPIPVSRLKTQTSPSDASPSVSPLSSSESHNVRRQRQVTMGSTPSNVKRSPNASTSYSTNGPSSTQASRARTQSTPMQVGKSPSRHLVSSGGRSDGKPRHGEPTTPTMLMPRSKQTGFSPSPKQSVTNIRAEDFVTRDASLESLDPRALSSNGHSDPLRHERAITDELPPFVVDRSLLHTEDGIKTLNRMASAESLGAGSLPSDGEGIDYHGEAAPGQSSQSYQPRPHRTDHAGRPVATTGQSSRSISQRSQTLPPGGLTTPSPRLKNGSEKSQTHSPQQVTPLKPNGLQGSQRARSLRSTPSKATTPTRGVMHKRDVGSTRSKASPSTRQALGGVDEFGASKALSASTTNLNDFPEAFLVPFIPDQTLPKGVRPDQVPIPAVERRLMREKMARDGLQKVLADDELVSVWGPNGQPLSISKKSLMNGLPLGITMAQSDLPAQPNHDVGHHPQRQPSMQKVNGAVDSAGDSHTVSLAPPLPTADLHSTTIPKSSSRSSLNSQSRIKRASSLLRRQSSTNASHRSRQSLRDQAVMSTVQETGHAGKASPSPPSYPPVPPAQPSNPRKAPQDGTHGKKGCQCIIM